MDSSKQNIIMPVPEPLTRTWEKYENYNEHEEDNKKVDDKESNAAQKVN